MKIGASLGYQASVVLVGNLALLKDAEARTADDCEDILDKLPIPAGFQLYRVQPMEWPRACGRCIFPLANLGMEQFEYKVVQKRWVLGLKETYGAIWWEELPDFPIGYNATRLALLLVSALDKFMEALADAPKTEAGDTQKET